MPALPLDLAAASGHEGLGTLAGPLSAGAVPALELVLGLVVVAADDLAELGVVRQGDGHGLVPNGLVLVAHAGVPSILHGIVRAARQHAGDLGPLVAQLGLHLDDDAVFLRRPLALLDGGVEVVVPSADAKGRRR
eukprot:scaffold1850_cov194-Pinguiococcus_pyrenoidosus.AAC.54